MKKYHLKNIYCASCAPKIEEKVGKLEEVKFVSVNFANPSITKCVRDFHPIVVKHA